MQNYKKKIVAAAAAAAAAAVVVLVVVVVRLGPKHEQGRHFHAASLQQLCGCHRANRGGVRLAETPVGLNFDRAQARFGMRRSERSALQLRDKLRFCDCLMRAGLHGFLTQLGRQSERPSI